jgi:hypothetical protein
MRVFRYIAIAVVAPLVLTGCGGSSDVKPAKGDTSANTVQGKEAKRDAAADRDAELKDEAVAQYFDAISYSDPEKMEAVKSVVAPGSIAAAYLQEQSDVSNAGIDAGTPYDGGPAKKIDGGFENCDETDDENSCTKWTDLEQVNGRLAKFTVNGTDITDRIAVGDGTKANAGSLASVEFLSTYKSVQSEVVFVNLRVTSDKEPVNLNLYSATYRGTDKRQSTATADSTGPTELEADSTAYVSLIFKAGAIGGDVKLGVSDSDYNEIEATIKTR